VLDQPNLEMRKLEKVMIAFADAEELERKRSEARNKNKGKHGS
jgi:hypothetical protein